MYVFFPEFANRKGNGLIFVPLAARLHRSPTLLLSLVNRGPLLLCLPIICYIASRGNCVIADSQFKNVSCNQDYVHTKVLQSNRHHQHTLGSTGQYFEAVLCMLHVPVTLLVLRC